jgi:hypothetical protein
MTREQLNDHPAQLIKITERDVKVVQYGTRKECWASKSQTVSRGNTSENNYIVILKK